MSNIIFDSHCHPQLSQYDEDRDDMLRRAKDVGVFMICVGTDYETSKQGTELAQKYENMWATVGLHPNDSAMGTIAGSAMVPIALEMLKNPKAVAIGEVGLDYYRTPEPDKQEIQKEVLKQFLKLAMECDKPVILHSRDAGKGSTGKVHADMIPIIENWKLEIENSARPWRAGVAHSFTGDVNDARKYLDLGFYLGFNGILTFARQYDEVVKYAPLDRILLETDAPFLSPEPYRGKRNEPARVIEVAKKIAELRSEPLEKVIEQTTKNCQKLFNMV